MSTALQHDYLVTPITALAIITIVDASFILAGEGPLLKIFHLKSNALLVRKRIFHTQSIHGIAVQQEKTPGVHSDVHHLLVWGARSFSFVTVSGSLRCHAPDRVREELLVRVDDEMQASDWILDAAFRLGFTDDRVVSSHLLQAVAVTAHNALLRLRSCPKACQSPCEPLSRGTRSILYSAHLVWQDDRHHRVLVAAGTVFGAIIVWSSHVRDPSDSPCLVHHVYHGHEGSVFGVQISPPLSSPKSKHGERLLTSCSDDRTIRVWPLNLEPRPVRGSWEYEDSPAHKTGFQSTGPDLNEKQTPSSSPCLAVAWAHASRIWGLRFIPSSDSRHDCQLPLALISYGEDATYQTWHLTYDDSRESKSTAAQWTLTHGQTATFHTGKHIWSSTTGLDAGGAAFVVAGGADGRITCFFPRKHPTASVAPVGSPNAFILNNVLDQLQLLGSEGHLDTSANVPMEMDSRAKDSLDQVPNGPYDVEGKSSSVSVIASRKKTKLDAFKQYGFVAPNHIIAVTERGHILRASQTLHSPVQWKSVAQVPCVQSFARIVTSQEAAITFISATDGGLYSYSHKSEALQIITTSFPRIAGLFCQAVNILDTKGTKVRTLQLILTTLNSSSFHHGILPLDPPRQDNLDRPISYGEMKLPSQFVVTSVLVLEDAPLLLVGSRAGALAVFSHRQGDEIESTPSDPREAWKVFLKLHDRDAVTSILCLGDNPTVHDRGLTYILTTGRDGTYAVHELSWADDLEIMELKTVHRSSPPLGPMIEGCYYNTEGELILYGFRGQQFVTWNESRQSEIMSVACGGAHRIWDYCPPSQGNETASFVWSQASQMRLYSQKGGSHQILQKGGHGREIKTIAISPLELDISGVPSQLIATGSEDTTIRLFTYRPDGDQLVEPVFHCHGVLTKHTTGIQHLQWSPCGTYLFSSGGYEEFFVWRIRQVPGFGVGFVCEGVCPVESKAPDLRITAFDVMVVDGEKDDDQGLFLISMAFSDASLRTYLYNASPTHFQYLWTDFTPLKCCPTQVHHHITSTDINLITAGTNGHVTICNLTPILRESSIITENNRLRSSHQIAPDIVSSSPPTKVSFHHHRIHQNAIKSLTTAPLTRQTLLIATGGDDNALGLTLVTFPPTSSDDSDSRSIAPEISTLLLPSAHASAITALAFLPSSQEPSSLPSLSPPITDPKPPSNKELTSLRLLSTGNDQVLHTWRITINLAAPSPPRILKTNPPEESRNQMENVQIRREDSSPTPVAVADVADMAVLGAVRGSVRRGGDDRGTDDDEHGLRREGKENGLRVVICGVGVEVFRV